MMKEIAYSIGNSPRLVGIYTENDLTDSSSASSENKPTILLLNSGLLPNMGPFRLYVELARKFAKMGFNTFRFDFSGIGDSSQHTDTRSFRECYMSDLKAVMDFLEAKREDHQFILMGICTGARNAQFGMAADTRVIGAVSIDGHIYKTPRYYIHLYGPKLFSLKLWLTRLKRILTKITASSGTVVDEPQNTEPTSAFRHTYQSQEETEKDFKKFIDRGVPFHCIFTGNWCKYKNQLSDNFKGIDFGETIEVTYMEETEHIFPLIEDRKTLTTTLVDWLNRKFGP